MEEIDEQFLRFSKRNIVGKVILYLGIIILFLVIIAITNSWPKELQDGSLDYTFTKLTILCWIVAFILILIGLWLRLGKHTFMWIKGNLFRYICLFMLLLISIRLVNFIELILLSEIHFKWFFVIITFFSAFFIYLFILFLEGFIKNEGN